MNTEKILQKYPNSPRVLNFREMARTSKIDQLVFDMTLGQLEKMQKAIIQLEDLDYVEHLSPEELNNIVNIIRQ